MTQTVSLICGAITAVAVGIWLGRVFDPPIGWTAGVTVLCAVWWVFEPIPMAATGLVPFAVFPLVGVLSPVDVADSYGNAMILLMLGGFMLSRGMETTGTHRRVALSIVRAVGGASGRRVVLGFMLAACLLSMWISNAASSVMLLPVALAVLESNPDRKLRTSLLLGIAYAASIGGIGTPIGTPPNLVFFAVFEKNFDSTPSFSQWMLWAAPVVATMIPTAAWLLTRHLDRTRTVVVPEVGNWRAAEVRMLSVFAVAATLWVTRSQPFGGWSSLSIFSSGSGASKDATVALLAAVAMFIVPTGEGGRKLLNWEQAAKIPWSILIMFGGGIAIAKGFQQSGLSQLIGNQLAEIGQLPTILAIALICLGVTFLTEITSNTATASLLLPILAATAQAANLDPKLIMIPATFSVSFAFMLPVATAPNAIVYGSDRLHVTDMVREGVKLNLVGVVVVTTVCYLLFRW
ncbi:MAG: SLC13 family permease [Pirellulaceae bacterium]|nr:SLC13/DASS family transporter [Planctomycetales bacterium]